MSDIATVAVIGAGTMGSRIAFRVVFGADYRVVVTDTDRRQLDRTRAQAEQVAARMSEMGYRTAAETELALGRLSFTGDLADSVAGADLVIEAVIEDRTAKRECWERLARYSGEAAILATNSSTYFASELAAVTGRGARCCGMHFSHPMTMLALCEVTRTPATHDSVIRSVVAFLKSVQCTPVVLEKEVFAHLCNRVLLLLADEALRLVEDGCASVEDVDAAFKVGLGFPFGPFEMIDNTGLDVVSEMLREGTNHELTRPPPAILAEKIRAGDLGRKTGRGFWTYERSGG